MAAAKKTTIVPDARADDDYDARCRRCPRLAAFVDAVRRDHPGYWCAPVPPYGPRGAKLLIVGLAPGMHGANATGRVFTGDYAGLLLYRTLHAYGYATLPASVSRDDALALVDCRITNAVKCLPPQNKPLASEVANCNRYLAADLSALAAGAAVLALGRLAHDAVLKALGAPARAHAFGHGARHALRRGEIVLFDSYHCSRYNTNTRRLTESMFRTVFDAIDAHFGRDRRVA